MQGCVPHLEIKWNPHGSWLPHLIDDYLHNDNHVCSTSAPNSIKNTNPRIKKSDGVSQPADKHTRRYLLVDIDRYFLTVAKASNLSGAEGYYGRTQSRLYKGTPPRHIHDSATCQKTDVPLDTLLWDMEFLCLNEESIRQGALVLESSRRRSEQAVRGYLKHTAERQVCSKSDLTKVASSRAPADALPHSNNTSIDQDVGMKSPAAYPSESAPLCHQPAENIAPPSTPISPDIFRADGFSHRQRRGAASHRALES